MMILDIIKKGEGKKTEFKRELPSSEKIAKTLVSFANIGGGRLIVGVSDNGEIVGINDLDITSQMDRISNIIHDLVHPVIIPDIYTFNIEDKILLIVEVFPSPIKPHFLKNIGKMDGTYIRVGATNKKADLEYIQELERQRLNISFDEDLWINQNEEINIDALIEILNRELKRPITEKDLLNLKLMRQQHGKKTYTNAVPIILGLFEHAHIKCARFKGNTMDIFIDQKEFKGDLFMQLEQAMAFLLTHINLHGEVGNDYITRIDEYEIPPEALREIVTNAIIHRDYNMAGSDIKIAVFDERIEIISPGGLPKGITLEDIISGRSEIRNKVIVRLFNEANKIEQWGRGIQRTFALCKEKGLKEPVVNETGLFIKFVFYRKQDAKQDAKQDVKRDAKQTITKSEEIILERFEKYETVKTTEAMQFLGLSKPRTSAILKQMVEKNLIDKRGQSRATVYVKKNK